METKNNKQLVTGRWYKATLDSLQRKIPMNGNWHTPIIENQWHIKYKLKLG